MFLKFYDNIFASAFRCYDKYENGARMRAATFVAMCWFGTIALVLIVVRDSAKLDWSGDSISTYIKTAVVVTGLILLIFSMRYYSDEKSKLIVEHFEQKTRQTRVIWGVFSVILFVVQYVMFIYLLY